MNHMACLRYIGCFVFLAYVSCNGIAESLSTQIPPIGDPDLCAEYHLDTKNAIPESNVKSLIVALGPVVKVKEKSSQWFQLQVVKQNGEHFTIWILTDTYPLKSIKQANESVTRYIVCEGDGPAIEYRHRYAGQAVLPVLGAWYYLFPQPLKDDEQTLFPDRCHYLGQIYNRVTPNHSTVVAIPKELITLELLPDALIGVPHNTKQKDDTRRYDDSEYEYIRLTRSDYDEMIDAGMNCFRVDNEQLKWIERRDVFYWGIGGQDVHFPENLYRSNYLGPQLFLDEPAVCTRDHVLRPRLREDQAFRKTITPQFCFDEFVNYFNDAKNKKNPAALIQSLAARPDVDTGDMTFLQNNLYTWETMIATALYQLGEDRDGPPSSIVFEPPGRIGSKRVLPEMNMTYGCQIPVNVPGNFIDVIYGFLRGAARSTDKTWGTSIYGSVDRDDAAWFLTHAYDLGAELFFFWDSARLACVPYRECLASARTLRNHIENHPVRDLARLKRAAEIAILIPPGYNLGHVHLGKGSLWGLGELNLERVNVKGVKYRSVMGNFFTEIERCLRLGIAFDLFWDLPVFQSDGYREIVRIREDGNVDEEKNGALTTYSGARIPTRPEGDPPHISIELSTAKGKTPLKVTALARLTEGASPIYYTSGSNQKGVYINEKVFWELYGPEEEDYRTLSHAFNDNSPRNLTDPNTIEIEFSIDRPGQYRLRAATCDLAGRAAIVWKTITVDE